MVAVLTSTNEQMSNCQCDACELIKLARIVGVSFVAMEWKSLNYKQFIFYSDVHLSLKTYPTLLIVANL